MAAVVADAATVCELVAEIRADVEADREPAALELSDTVAGADIERRTLTLVLGVRLRRGVGEFDARGEADRDGFFDEVALVVGQFEAVPLSPLRPLAVEARVLVCRRLSVSFGVCVAEGDNFADELSVLDTLPCVDDDGVEVVNVVADGDAVVVTENVDRALAESAAVPFVLEVDETDTDGTVVTVPCSRDVVDGDGFDDADAKPDTVELGDERGELVVDALGAALEEMDRSEVVVESMLKEASADRDTLGDVETDAAATLADTFVDSVAAKLAES